MYEESEVIGQLSSGCKEIHDIMLKTTHAAIYVPKIYHAVPERSRSGQASVA